MHAHIGSPNDAVPFEIPQQCQLHLRMRAPWTKRPCAPTAELGRTAVARGTVLWLALGPADECNTRATAPWTLGCLPENISIATCAYVYLAGQVRVQ